MKKNEKGFSLVEGLVVIVIVGLIGFVGWYVWEAKNSNDNKYSAVSKNKTTKTIVSKGEFKIPDGWVEHKYESLGISFWAPKDWSVEEEKSINHVSLDAPKTVTMKTVDAESETFRFHLNIEIVDTNRPDEVLNEAYIFSSDEITTTNLLKSTYLTLHSSVESTSGPGVDGFSVTQTKYSSTSKHYKPAMRISNRPYEIWGGIYYIDSGDGAMSPRLSVDSFNNLTNYKVAQDILKSMKAL